MYSLLETEARGNDPIDPRTPSQDSGIFTISWTAPFLILFLDYLQPCSTGDGVRAIMQDGDHTETEHLRKMMEQEVATLFTTSLDTTQQ